MVERLAVNEDVVGPSPTGRANKRHEKVFFMGKRRCKAIFKWKVHSII